MKRIFKNTSPMDRDLEYFMELFRQGSISKAADFLDMDQGNLSRALTRLEKKVGEKLFHRHQKGLVPNSKAKALATTLSEMKSIWDSSMKEDSSASTTIRSLKVGFHPSIGQSFLPKLLNPLKEIVSGSLEFQMGTSGEMVQNVMNRQLDLAIAINPIKSKDLVVKTIGIERIELVGISENKEAKEKTLLISPEMLFLGKIVQDFSFTQVIHIANYEIIAATCVQNAQYTGVIPSGVRERFPKLKVLRSLREGIKVNLITYPGSGISGHLASLAKI